MLSRRQLAINAHWLLFMLLALLAALFIAWQALARVDFLYPLWYDVIHIDRTIATYGPQNRYRKHFEHTTKAERVRLFGALVEAIHRQGRGLAGLVYHDPAGRPIASLLTPPEIVHLQDVAQLVDRLRPVGWGALVALPVWIALLWRRKLSMPPFQKLCRLTALALGGVAALVLLLGPVNVFYALHTWIFPKEHPWFFYYQDSLMTMLMKAPVIFGYIALTLAALSLLLILGLLWLTRKILG